MLPDAEDRLAKDLNRHVHGSHAPEFATSKNVRDYTTFWRNFLLFHVDPIRTSDTCSGQASWLTLCEKNNPMLLFQIVRITLLRVVLLGPSPRPSASPPMASGRWAKLGIGSNRCRWPRFCAWGLENFQN